MDPSSHEQFADAFTRNGIRPYIGRMGTEPGTFRDESIFRTPHPPRP